MGGGEREYDWSKEGHRNERGRDNDRQRNYRSYSNDRRSSDYRNDDGYSRSDDYDHSDRKYRPQNEHRKDFRERERRSRSRSRSCDRDSRNYEQHYEADRNYNRHEERDRQREKKEVPNNTLMIRNLPLHFTDKDVSSEINKFGLYPKDVRLMKHKETGQSRGFAFIEFTTVEHAVQLKELTQGCMVIENEYECSLHFSFPKEASAADKNVIKNDWSCPKCGINNFKRRDECFKCGTSKDDPRIFEKPEVIHHPTNGIAALTLPQSSMMHSILKLNLLQLRNLSSSTTEERVLTIIGTLTSLPIKSIRIAQDPVSQKNMCVLELHSVLEATQLFHVISSLTTGFVIDDSLVSLAYGPRADTSSVAASSFGSQNAAMAALAAAQWKNLDDSSSKGKQPSEKAASLGSVTVNGVEYPKHATPNYASFQLDATSGYYYDASTGFYYDSSSQYFYNSQTQKYMYYDSANQIYVSVDSAGQATATNMTPTVNSTTPQKVDAIKSSVDDNISKQQDKVKTAKKIAKDMEKWAKTLNQKKEIAKPLTIPQAETVPMEPMGSINFSGGSGSGIISSSPITETVSSVLEKPVANLELTLPATDPIVSAISVDPFEIIRVEEDKRIDWERLVCHLCRRQFGSKEQLEKHKEFSGLHKQNLVALHPSILTEEQLQHVENVERGYRDRARERREKFGFDDTPEFSKKKLEKMKEPVETVSAQALPITDDNVGSKMLKAMGWTEGSGLGKSNQGTADIIQVERRRGGLGLGNNNATFTRESYKDAVRRTALARFKELSEG